MRNTKLLELEMRLEDKIDETRGSAMAWTRAQSERINMINEQLDSLCHYLGIKMKRCDKPYWKISSLGEEEKEDADITKAETKLAKEEK